MNNYLDFWMCDFETTTDPEDCRVWLWGVWNPLTDKHFTGLDIESFINTISTWKSQKLFFHNLKFDGIFILDYILKFRQDLYKGCLIGPSGQFYMLQIGSNKIYDSLKLINATVANIGRDWGTGLTKGEIDYKKYRPIGYIPNEEEYDYLWRDIKIVGLALAKYRSEGRIKITQGSNALHNFRERYTKRMYKRLFPPLEKHIDDFVRKGYKGGWCYLNPLYTGKMLFNINVIDVNSLYPFVMLTKKYPIGEAEYFEGKPDFSRPFVVRVHIDFEVKDNAFPWLSYRHNFRYGMNEKIISSNGELEEFTFTNPDLELLFKTYDIFDIDYLEGYYFRWKSDIFTEYVWEFTEKKIQGKKDGNIGKYYDAKIMQNSLYGKFATNVNLVGRMPYIKDNIVHFTYKKFWEDGEDFNPLTMEKRRHPEFTPIGAFITAYARQYTIETAMLFGDRFVYSDTDSIAFLGDAIPEEIVIDPTILGAWDLEKQAFCGKYLHTKCYALLYGKKGKPAKWHYTIAGLPESMREDIHIQDFKEGMQMYGKLLPKRVSGGVVLEETSFEIK